MIDVITPTNKVLMSASYLNPNPTFPTLRIVPVEKLVPHERCDTARALSLEERLIADGVLRNPPIVAPLQDTQGGYVVLDGANRTNALKTMRVPHILVQVASPGESGFDLTTWNQVVLGISPEGLLALLGGIPDINLKMDKSPGLLPDIIGISSVIQVHLPLGEVYTAYAQASDHLRRVQLLNFIMDRIGKYARLDRTHLQSIDILTDLQPDLAGLIVFPCFKIEEIIQMATARQMIPAGITRFTISPRALRVNYKICDLSAEKSLAEKNALLMAWIQERIARKGVRSYDETTVMFDE